MRVIGTDDKKYMNWQSKHSNQKRNGAYHYAKEIESIILPHFKKLKLVIVTCGASLLQQNEVCRGMIIICHDNYQPTLVYRRLMGNGILWICSKQSTCDKLTKAGENAVFIPLSVDVKHIKKFKTRKTKNMAFVGNAWAFKKEYLASLSPEIDQLNGMDRDDLLKEMAHYRYVIAEGRCLIEAKVLGCKTKVPEYQSFESIDREVLDCSDVLPLWRKVLQDHAKQFRGMRLIQARREFNDMADGCHRRAGEYWWASIKRANELKTNPNNLVEVLQ